MGLRLLDVARVATAATLAMTLALPTAGQEAPPPGGDASGDPPPARQLELDLYSTWEGPRELGLGGLLDLGWPGVGGGGLAGIGPPRRYPLTLTVRLADLGSPRRLALSLKTRGWDDLTGWEKLAVGLQYAAAAAAVVHFAGELAEKAKDTF